MSKLATMSFAFAQTCSPSSWRPTRRTLARFATPIATHLSAGRESYLRPNCHSIWFKTIVEASNTVPSSKVPISTRPLDRNLDFAPRTNLIQVRNNDN